MVRTINDTVDNNTVNSLFLGFTSKEPIKLTIWDRRLLIKFANCVTVECFLSVCKSGLSFNSCSISRSYLFGIVIINLRMVSLYLFPCGA